MPTPTKDQYFYDAEAAEAMRATACIRCEEAQASPGHDDCEACRAALAVMEQDQAGCTDPHLDRDTDRCRCGGEWVWHDAAQRHGCEAEVNPQPAVYSVDGEVVDLDELAADEGFSSADLKTIRNLHPGHSWAGEPAFTIKRER